MKKRLTLDDSPFYNNSPKLNKSPTTWLPEIMYVIFNPAINTIVRFSGMELDENYELV